MDLLNHLDKIHTTLMGYERLKKNLNLSLRNEEILTFCKNNITDKNCNISKNGKNRYCTINGIKRTINVSSYTIITAHKMK